ncbi:MAG: 30S ribosomal protein S8 [bacterium]|nr:30S ribosomal protein S8 [bacterium]
MAMTDPIGDMLTRIRNACMAKHRTVDIPASRVKQTILDVLMREGYIEGWQPVEGAAHPTIRVQLRYYRHKPVIEEIRRVSTPGLRRYARVKDLKKVRGGLGVAIVSTSQGIMTDHEARKRGLGGEVIAEVW